MSESPRLHRIPSHELSKLEGYLDALERAFIFPNERPSFAVDCFRLNATDVTELEILRTAFPHVPDEELKFLSTVDIEQARAHINGELYFPNIDFSGRPRPVPLEIEDSLQQGFWEHLEACIPLMNAKFVSCGDEVPWFSIGGFTYFIFAAKDPVCLVLVCNVRD